MTLKKLLDISMTISLVAGAGLLSACDGDDGTTNTTADGGETDNSGSAIENLGQRADDLAQQAQAAWRKFVDEINSRLARYEPEIEQIKNSARDKADAQLDQLVAELEEKTAAARAKLDELSSDLANATEDERAELNRMLQELGDSLERAKARLTELDGGVRPPSLSGGAGGGTGAPIDD
jgi:chromosome segregation ATPase